MPAISLIAGAVIGLIAGEYLDIDYLDVSSGFLSFAVTSLFAFYKLRQLARTSMLNIKGVMSERVLNLDTKSDEERRFEGYLGNR